MIIMPYVTLAIAAAHRPGGLLVPAGAETTALTRTKPPGMPVRSHTRW
jgi:hypothetical protein